MSILSIDNTQFLNQSDNICSVYENKQVKYNQLSLSIAEFYKAVFCKSYSYCSIKIKFEFVWVKRIMWYLWHTDLSTKQELFEIKMKHR